MQSTTVAPSRLTLRLLPSQARPQAAQLWRALERTLGGDTSLSCSWEWTETWLEHYGDVVKHSFVVGERDGETRAIALLTQAPTRPLRPRTRHLGTAGEPRGSGVFVERNRLLVAPGERTSFTVALLDMLERDRGWDRICFDGFQTDDAAAVIEARPDAAAVTEQCPVAELQHGDDVLASLSGSRRQRIRRTLRAFGDLEVDWPTRPEDALGVLDELIVLHQQRWEVAGRPGAFASPRFTAFHRALVARLVPRQRAALVRVRRGAETVGCLYGFVDGGRLCFYQGGLRRYEDNRLRAGVAAHVAFMRESRARGLAEYDFLAPASRYKQELSSRVDELAWVELTRPHGWRMRGTRVARSLRRSD